MRTPRTAVIYLSLMLVLVGCQRTNTEPPSISDPPEAFPPHTILRLDQTREWGGCKIDVQNVAAFLGDDKTDIDLTVDVAYTNLASEQLSPPTDVKFELDGHTYPAVPTGRIQLPDKRYVDGPIPGGVSANGKLKRTLVHVAKADPQTWWEEQHDIVGRTSLVFGAPGTAQTVFPFS